MPLVEAHGRAVPTVSRISRLTVPIVCTAIGRGVLAALMASTVMGWLSRCLIPGGAIVRGGVAAVQAHEVRQIEACTLHDLLSLE